MSSEVLHFKHKVGDGLHYVTDNFRELPDGSWQEGDTSEGCVLYNLHLLLFTHKLPSLHEVWNQVYPEDQMALEDLAYIISSAIPFTERFNPEAPDDIQDVLKDVLAIGCNELADLVQCKLRDKGVMA